MNKPQWLELPISRTKFYGPKDVRAIEVRLYLCTEHYLEVTEVIHLAKMNRFTSTLQKWQKMNQFYRIPLTNRCSSFYGTKHIYNMYIYLCDYGYQR